MCSPVNQIDGSAAIYLESKEQILEVSAILEELKAERARLDRAIAVLRRNAEGRHPRGSYRHPAVAAPQPDLVKGRKGSMTPEGRKRLSLTMKKRWAERKKKDS